MVLPENQREKTTKLHANYLEGGAESAGIWTVRHKSGELFKVKVTASRLITEQGKKFKVTTVAPLEPKQN